MEIKRLFDYLTLHTDKRPETEFVSGKEIKANGTKEWRHYTFREVKDISDKISQLLINLGLKKEDKIAIISANRPEWNFADLGSQQIGIINVPMYPTISEADYEFIFKDANVQYAFVGDESIYKKVEPLLGRVGSLKGIFTFDRIAGADYLPEVLDRIDHIDQDEIENRKRLVDADEVVTYIYTSGTTGNPKGVMLTHNNIVSNLTSVARMLPFKEGKSLSFLPL
ncbi:MAG TPA: AMP-binding protein, partial [Saprospiraceae bacterium]|nr:AMP-binding protein [Saprospiraceae bacterium]